MTQKRYVVRHGDSTLLIGILTSNVLKPTGSKVMAQIVVFVFSVTLTLTFDLCSIFVVTRIAHDVLEYPCEVSLESVQYEWVICCG